MNTAYRPRTSDETLAEHLNLQRATTTVHRKYNAPMQIAMPATPTATMDAMRMRSDTTATGIYVIGSDGGGDGGSNPATMERKQHNRQSWLNMRRQGEDASNTPSPQTTRSYVSNITTVGTATADGVSISVGGRNSGNLSGRTTAASGRISTSGATTISGSNNTLNDIISDYHSSDYQFAAVAAATGGSAGDAGGVVGLNGGIVGAASPNKNLSSNGSFNLANGSTVKLLPAVDDETNQQTKCSAFRGLVLCICLNVTYANIVRFPRELDEHGTAYLIPYLILLFLVGLPIVLLEISVGQFLGQGAAHTWRSSPIFKGACIVGRFASWLATIWVSLQAIVAVAFVGTFMTNTMPFRECLGKIRIAMNRTRYTGTNISGQECLQKTFLTPFWDIPYYYGLLSIGLICIWIVVMLCTHNARILRRCLFCFGLIGFVLLCCLTGWEVNNSFERSYFPQLWPYEIVDLYDSNIWFNALMQVLFATNCGSGALPMLTGKFLYKGDAVRTSIVYLCFNLLINALAVTLFMVQFDLSANAGNAIAELKPLTAIYDRILYDRPINALLVKLIPSLLYVLIVIAALVTIAIAIYTSTRLVPRHPNYVVSLIALVLSIISLSAPRFIIARILDTRVIGTMIITALIFDLIAVTWIYGAKNIYTDLEFSIGRPIFKGWMCLWCICPAILTGLLVWWCSDDDQFDLLAEYLPRWAPILFVLAVIFIIACIQIFRQVDYNFFGMICEASKPAKEWGPADPLARHAWKQWRSVCQDTGRRDFTLRRRGTRDYTHSIKKGQYSTANKYANGHATQTNWKSSTPGNSSPNYSGSMFGDSAIEEDISVDKFPGITQQQQQQFVPFQANDGKPIRYSQRARAQTPQTRNSSNHNSNNNNIATMQQQQHHHQHQQQQQYSHNERPTIVEQQHREIVYIRRLSDDGQHATRIKITPSNDSITYGGARNPLGRSHDTHANAVKRTASCSVVENNRKSVISVGGAKLPPAAAIGGSGEHICWRKFTVNPQEYSTEL